MQVDNAYLEVSCNLPCESEEELPSLLNSWPLLGSQVFPAQAGRLGVVIYLPGGRGDIAEKLIPGLAELGAADIRSGPFEPKDWLSGYRSNITPFPVGNCWWIDPHPERPTLQTGSRLRLVVEPRMAFGSGSHESTQLVLEALEDLPVSGSRILDIGTGSGILALAADRLEAARVVAIDIDPQAIWVARQIADQQEWVPRVQYTLGPIACINGLSFDVVVCNMISSSLLPLVGEIRRLLAAEGIGVLSGILLDEVDPVIQAIVAAGFRIVKQRIAGEWASLIVNPGKPTRVTP